MEKANNKLSTSELKELIDATYFERKELQQWYRGFMKDCPDGQLDCDGFQSVYKRFFPFSDPTQFVEYVFRVFDTNHNGYIDFREFICALSIISRGNQDEKLEWAFRLYDIDNNGYITRDEMRFIVEAVYKMINSDSDVSVDENTPEKRVEKIFQLMDKDNDGKLTLAEFREGCRQDQSILHVLKLFENIV
jgi:Ca2+-binding EF-hand superfamily protein